MTQPRLAVQKGRERYYNDPVSGLELPSVTTVIKETVRAHALEFWKANKIASRAVTDLEELAERASESEWEAVKWLTQAPYEVAEDAGLIGDVVHAIMENYAFDGVVGDISAKWQRPLKDFIATCDPEFWAVELSVFGPNYGFAGTLDAVAEVDIPQGRLSDKYNRELVILDYKTSKSCYPYEIAMQLAALAHAEYGIDGEGNQVEIPGFPVTSGLIVHLRPDEDVALYYFKDLEAPFKAFCGLVSAFNGSKDARRWMKRVR